MDKEKLQQNIVKYFQKLPKESQDFFASMSWVKVLEEIETKHHLSVDQIETLGTETTLVLLGIIHVDEYIKNISDLDMKKEILDQVLIEIEEKILKTGKENLIQTFESNAFSLAEESLDNPTASDPRFSQLPENVQDAISKSNWRETLYEIAKKYKLNIEQMGALEESTVAVISNTISPNSYEKELSSKISIPKDDLSNLVSDINNNLMKKIREIMKTQDFSKTEDPDESVPLPPYRNTANNQEPKTQTVELESLEATKEKLSEIKNDFIISKNAEIPNEVQIPKPSQITPNIFNVPKNIIEEKLQGATSSKHSTSDHSNESGIAPSYKAHDPYREEI